MRTTNTQFDQNGDSWGIHERVAIPIRTKEQIERERVERRLAEIAEEEAREVAAAGARDNALDVKTSLGLGDEWADPLADYPGPTLKILDHDAIDSWLSTAGSQSRDSSTKSRGKELGKLLRSKGEYRKLAQVPADWRDRLPELQMAFPNFREVIDHLGAMFSLAPLDRGVPRLDPLVLLGPPGVGKSLFAEKLAKFLGSGLTRLNMENSQTGSPLSGSEEYWGNTKYGMVFEALVEGEFGNPVIFIDEVDKASTDDRHSPLSPLYLLLEPGTAAHFRDLSVPRVELDASRIIWILTANQLDPIPGPIRDRVQVFEIPAFSDDEARHIAQQIFENLQVDLRVEPAFAPLSDEVLAQLTGTSARQQRKLLKEAFGRALSAGRRMLLVSDFRWPAPQKARRPIRFY